MARLTNSQRSKLPTKSFALPKERAYPVNDIAHARNALARAAQHASPDEKATIRATVCRRYPGIESCKQPPK